VILGVWIAGFFVQASEPFVPISCHKFVFSANV